MSSAVYHPFLKLKQNEIRAISDLDNALMSKLIPVFDIPRSPDMGEGELVAKLKTGLTELIRRWPKDIRFYLDVFDINPMLKPGGLNLYQYTLDLLVQFVPFPVIGLDRDADHINAAIAYIDTNGAKNVGRVGIRLLLRDIEFYELIEDDLMDLASPFISRDLDLDVLIDLRNIYGKNPGELVKQINDFCTALISSKKVPISKIVISSCSIPRVIAEATPTGGSCHIDRLEKTIFDQVKLVHGYVSYGDYATISPEYQDVPVVIMNRVAAPKVIYTYLDSYFITRGTLFKTHPDGYGQYYDLAAQIVNQAGFRGKQSAGDVYIENVSNKAVKPGSPSTWVRATVNSHLTFLAQ